MSVKFSRLQGQAHRRAIRTFDLGQEKTVALLKGDTVSNDRTSAASHPCAFARSLSDNDAP
jgi:hypothetical protein